MIERMSVTFHALATLLCVVILVFTFVSRSAAGVDIAATMFVVMTGLGFLASVTSRQRGGIDYLFWFFFLFFIAIPAHVQISEGVFPWSALLKNEHMALAFGLLSISSLCYIAGQRMALRKTEVWLLTDTLDDIGTNLFYTRWAWGIALFAVILALAAGPSNLFVARSERPEGGFEGLTQQFLFTSRSISLLAMVMMIYLTRFARSSGLRRQNALALLLFLPFFLIIYFPPALARFVMFGTAIALSCTFVNYALPAVKAFTTAAALLILFFVFPVAKFISSGEFALDDFVSRIGTVAFDQFIFQAEFDSFMWITSTIEYLMSGSGEIRWGYNFLGVLLFFVPRALWPGKPVDTGLIVSTGMDFRYTNVASPLPAEALMAFGIAGPILVFVFAGFAISRIETGARWPGEDRTHVSRFFLYATLMGFVTIILRGALNGVAPIFGSAFLVLAIMMLMRRKRIIWGQAR